MSNFTLPKTPFCFNEKNKYKLFEYPKFSNNKFWKIKKKYKNEKYKVLFISGPARHGNHLLLSLLDGNKGIPHIPGEDDSLRTFFSHVNKNQSKTINKIKTKNKKFILNLSCQNYKDKKNFGFNKWKKLAAVKKIHIPYWSGVQPKNQGSLFDYRGFLPNLDYTRFEKSLIKKKFNSFFDFWYGYMSSYNKLCVLNKKKKLNYNYFWFGSGLRRELFYILNQTQNIIILTPIRNFPEFYNSYCLPRYGKISYKKSILTDGWEHWKHKVVDYLILKKKYPKNVYIIKYEDMINKPKITIKKILKILKLKFNCQNLTPTLFDEPIIGNSSDLRNISIGKIYNTVSKFNKKYIPKDYRKILYEIDKVKL